MDVVLSIALRLCRNPAARSSLSLDLDTNPARHLSLVVLDRSSWIGLGDTPLGYTLWSVKVMVDRALNFAVVVGQTVYPQHDQQKIF